MADLLSKHDAEQQKISRNQEVEGEIIAILDSEIILDLHGKAEGTLPKRDLPSDQAKSLKVGDKLMAFVLLTENESGQVLLTSNRNPKIGSAGTKFRKFEEAMKANQALVGRALEVNKGGLIVEVNGLRGFLPSSQVALSQASDLDQMVGKDVTVSVIEVDAAQNRLILTQRLNLSDQVKASLTKLKVGETVEGTIAAVLAFGVFVSIPLHEGEGAIEGLVHVSEVSWEKVEDPNTLFKVGQKVSAKVISIDHETGRVNLSIRQLSKDPFEELASKYQADDVVKATVTKINANGVFMSLGEGESKVEGVIYTAKLDPSITYQVDQTVTVLVDTVEVNKRRVSLAPLITSTKGLIYK